jgi:hypothetical protein
MIKRLEQIAALVVAAGLALTSYWLFFSWAQGGGSQRREQPRRPQQEGLRSPASESAPGLDQPLLGGAVIEAGQMGLHLLRADRQALLLAEGDDPAQGAAGVLKGLAEQ